MNRCLQIVATAFTLFIASAANHALAEVTSNTCPEALNHTVNTLAENKRVNLCHEYLGKVVLIVNTASKCAFTGQYEGLEKLYKKYKDRGLVVLGFPSNDFGNQEPGSEKQIAAFCRLTYGVEFPMFQKVHASERNAAPLYKTLAKHAGEFPGWNFHKYLIDRNGKLAASVKSQIHPLSAQFVETLEKLL